MKHITQSFGLLYSLGILLTIAALIGCGVSENDLDNDSSDRSSAITFQLKFAQSSNHVSQAQNERAIGSPDICYDYMIDRVAVKVYRTQDDTEVASAEENCAEHSLTVDEVPHEENLYVVCKGNVDGVTLWQAQANDIIAVANQTTDIGILEMAYMGDDVSAPMIASTFPLDGATNVDLKASIAVVINEALAPGSISDQAITIVNNDVAVPGQVSYNPTMHTIIFTPADENGFVIDAVYTATFHSWSKDDIPITDEAGQPLAGDISWQFTTGDAVDTARPQIIATSPANGTTGIGPHSAISVLFSEPMDPASFIDRVFQVSSAHGTVSGQILYDEIAQTLVITPDSELSDDVLYTAGITIDAKDLFQNNLIRPYTWQFSTIESGGYYYSISTSTIPANGSGGSFSPDDARVPVGDNKTFDILPQPYHYLSELIVDGILTTPVSSYTFENVSANHKIQAVFNSINFIGHWAFDNNTDDAVGVNNGILDGASYVPGVYNQAIAFDGVDDFIDMSLDSNLSLTTFTLSAWVKMPDLIQPGWRTIMEHDRQGSNWFGLYKSTQKDTFHFRWAKSILATADFNTTIYPNTWYHIVGTFDNGTAKMYLNGVLDKTVTDTPVGSPNDSGLRIGRNQQDAEAFKAIIDDIRIYDAALSAQDIQALYNTP